MANIKDSIVLKLCTVGTYWLVADTHNVGQVDQGHRDTTSSGHRVRGRIGSWESDTAGRTQIGKSSC